MIKRNRSKTTGIADIERTTTTAVRPVPSGSTASLASPNTEQTSVASWASMAGNGATASPRSPVVASSVGPTSTPAVKDGLNIHRLELKQDQWEIMPSLVYKSFYSVASNMSTIKKWSDRVEDRLRENSACHVALQERVDVIADEAEQARQDVQTLAQEFRFSIDNLRLQGDASAICLKQLVQTVGTFFVRYGVACGVEIGGLGEYEPEPVSAPSVVTPPEDVEEGSNDIAQSLCPSSEEEAEEDTNAAAAAREVKDSAGELHWLGNRIEVQMEELEGAFVEKSRARERLDGERCWMQGKIEEIRLATERARERLLSWRDQLRENAHALDALGATILEARADIEELQSSQMRRSDVEAVVSTASQRLEEQRAQAELRLDAVAGVAEEHAARIDADIREMHRRTEESIEEHSLRVKQLLERSLNPVNAFLNSMRVRADVARSDLDGVISQLPAISGRIADALQEIRKCAEADETRALALAQHLVDVRSAQEGDRGNAKTRYEALDKSLAELGEKWMGDLRQVQESVGAATREYDAFKRKDFKHLGKDVSILEQKVMSLMNENVLPSKLSEARLYALELRLAEETDARLQLEVDIHARSGRVVGSTRGERAGQIRLPRLSTTPSPRKKHLKSLSFEPHSPETAAPPSARLLGQDTSV
eukprot:TRINITY_DN23080_c0_g1_i1.p1 TRINITY_DN23080_c0_g1~~TRINITY_DN23080_c0_g1_i1.p1  ORF type:complete len:655 (-),score=108.58 TRINITY_DN23080_c0_g1_i1:34-1998(-)